MASCSIRSVRFHVRTKKQKLTSPSSYVLVNDSAGEPARQLTRGRIPDQSIPGGEFEIGGATSGEDFPLTASLRTPLAAVAES